MKLWRACLVGVALVAATSLPLRAQLGSRTAQEWVATLDSQQRIASLKIDEVISRLRLKPGNIVADIGAGSGLFEGALSVAVSPGGIVYAEDIDQGLLDHIATRTKDTGITNVRGVLGTFTDPKLPTRTVDLAFINDVLHHIGDRPAYLKTLAAYLKPTGRIAVIDFIPGQGGHPTQPELQVSKDQATGWMAAAGLKVSEEITLFPDKWFVVYSKS